MSNANGWSQVPLGDVLVHRKEFIQIDDLKRYKRCRVQLHAQGVVLRDEVVGATIKTKAQQVCKSNEFLVAEIDAKMGGFGLVPPELDGAVVSSHYFLFVPREDRIDPKFLGFYAKTPQFREQVAARGTTNYAAIRPSHVLGYKLPLPPLAEQRRIVTKVDLLAAKIDAANELSSCIEADIKALAASLHFSLSKDRRVRMNSLVELSENRVSVVPSSSYPQVGIRGFGGGLFGKPALRGTDTTYRHFNKLNAGMLVLSQVKGWEGAIGVCPPELDGFFASPEYRTFRCIESTCEPQYLDMVVRSPWFRAYLQEATHGQGARRERTRPEQFLELTLPMPELADQSRAIRILMKLMSVAPIRAQSVAAQCALLPSILDRAFKGAL